jgi:hypothetical protein
MQKSKIEPKKNPTEIPDLWKNHFLSSHGLKHQVLTFGTNFWFLKPHDLSQDVKKSNSSNVKQMSV